SEDPSAFTISNSQAWTALTIAIHPAAAAGTTIALSATADVSAAPQRFVLRQADLFGTAGIDVAGQVQTGGSILARQAALDATADISAVPQRFLLRQVVIPGTADIASFGRGILLTRQVALDGTADIASVPNRVAVGVALLSATANVIVASAVNET